MDNKSEKLNIEGRNSIRQSKENGEGLIHIATHLPFVPKVAIGRGDFFLGCLFVWLISFLLGNATYFLPDNITTPVAIAGILFFVYLGATWYTKRFIDISPRVNARLVQVTLFILFVVGNVVISVQPAMLVETRKSIVSGALSSGESTVMSIVSVLYIVFILAFFFLNVYLFFKKGTQKHPNTSSGFRATEEGDKSNNSNYPLTKNPKEVIGEKSKKTLLVWVSAVGLLIAGWLYYDQAQNNEIACLQRVQYSGDIYKIYDDNEKRHLFSTQDEAMRYCMKVLR